MGPTKTGKLRMGKHSQKMDTFCTARMIATIHDATGRVEVKYIQSQTNHELGVIEYRNIPLPNSIKKEIQKQFTAGITIERIMDSKHSPYKLICTILCLLILDIRGTLGKRSERSSFLAEASRQQFITRQHCRLTCMP